MARLQERLRELLKERRERIAALKARKYRVAAPVPTPNQTTAAMPPTPTKPAAKPPTAPKPAPVKPARPSNTSGTKEAIDVIRAAGKLYSLIAGIGMTSEKLSPFKMARTLADGYSEFQEAFNGFKEVKAELLNLTETEFKEEIGPEISDALWPIYRDNIADVIEDA